LLSQGAFSFARLSAVSLRTNGFMLTTPGSTQGGALNFVRTMNYTPKFRPLLSSFCSLYLPPAALANEPWRAAARENRSTLTFKASCFRKVLFLLPARQCTLKIKAARIDFVYKRIVGQLSEAFN